jgi:hypothetical protein
MIPPAFVLSLLIGSLYGLGFFYLFGRKADRLVSCWAMGVIAFLAGQLAGAYHPVASWLLGEVHVVEGSVAAVAGLSIAHFVRLK